MAKKRPKYSMRRYAAICLVGGLAATGLLLWLLAEFHEEMMEPFLSGLDTSLMAAVHAYTGPQLTGTMEAFTFAGSLAGLVPIVGLLVIVLWIRREWSDGVMLIVAMLGAGLLMLGLKLHFKRVRPDVPWALAHEHSFSFPSGHSILAVVLYGVITYLLWTRVQDWVWRGVIILGALGFIACIGVSRVYLGVHYPTDVAAGYFVGLVWLGVVIVSDWDYRRRFAVGTQQIGIAHGKD